jgi:hypothetical protein
MVRMNQLLWSGQYATQLFAGDRSEPNVSTCGVAATGRRQSTLMLPRSSQVFRSVVGMEASTSEGRTWFHDAQAGINDEGLNAEHAELN